MPRPLPVGGSKRPAAPAPRAARPAPAPETDETDNILGGAFDEPEAPKVATPRPPAPAARKPAPRPTPVAAPTDERAETVANVARQYGTKGAPEAVARAAGLKGSELFGGSPSKSGGEVLETSQTRVAAPPRAGGGPPRRGLRDAVDLGPLDVSKRPTAVPSSAGFVPPPSVRDVDGAITYIMETNALPFPALSLAQQQTRDYAFRLWVTDMLAKFDVISEVTSEARAMIGGPLVGEEETGQVANAVAEMAAGAAQRATDTEADEEFGGDERAEEFTMPSGVTVTLEGLTDFVLRHARAKSYTVQGDLDKQLGEGVSIGKTPGYKEVKNDNNPTTKREKARKLAQAILDSLPKFAPAEAAPAPRASDDPFDDEDGDDDGEVEGQTTQEEFEEAKLALRSRAEALICEMCNNPSTHHKGLRGAGIQGNTCPGWQSATPEDEVALMVLVKDMEAFKTTWAHFLSPNKSNTAAPDVGKRGEVVVVAELGQQAGVGSRPVAVEHRGDRAQPIAPGSKSGGGAVGGGPKPRPPVGGAAPRGVAPRGGDNAEVERGGPDSGDDRDPFADDGPEGLDSADAGGPSEGAELAPGDYRAAAEQQRRDWASASGGEFTEKLTWAINYPPGDGNIPTPTALALDQASVSRRQQVVGWLTKYLDTNFFDGKGQLRPDIEYGSPSWRAFVAGRALARACEDYAANRHAEQSDPLKRAVKRAADEYLSAHFILSDDVFDPDFGEYVDMCAEAKRPVGTPIAELMGLLE